jgi:hypothetical protein
MNVVLLPLLVAASLAASGKQGDADREREIWKWKRALDEPSPAEDRLAARDVLAKRQAEAAVALYRLGQTDGVWPLLRHGPDPSLRSYLAARAQQGGPTRPIVTETDHEMRIDAPNVDDCRLSRRSMCHSPTNAPVVDPVAGSPSLGVRRWT